MASQNRTAPADRASDEVSSTPEGAAAPPAKIKPWVRLVALGAVLFTGWHVLASFLWIAPYSANAREVVGNKALSSYMLPFFGQSWSVFAPEPINGDYHFNVRATLGDGTETGWVSATDVELSMIQYTLTPPRAGIQSVELASAYKSAYDDLTDTQQAAVGGDYIVDEWEVGLEAALANQEGDDVSASESYLAEEHRAVAYATQVAHAIWGDEVETVQFRVSRQNIIPFADRHDPDATRPEPTIVLPGKRGPVVEAGQNEAAFADVFRAQFERISE